MHQIYSCSDENIEVFTTVIPSKVSSPTRRVKSSQHLLTKNMVIESELYTSRPLELLPHRRDRGDGEGRRSGRLQGSRQQGPHQTKAPARSVGLPEPKSSNLCGNRAYGKSLGEEYDLLQEGMTLDRWLSTDEMQLKELIAACQPMIPPVARISVKTPNITEVTTVSSEKGAVLSRGSRHFKKMTEDYPTLSKGAEASLPLTGSASCGVPNILRKMWTRHKKKSEYVGASNSAFEAD